jgi:hypothetical protein
MESAIYMRFCSCIPGKVVKEEFELLCNTCKAGMDDFKSTRY